jgi:LPXTG-motif cell wall-anchored protein
MNHSSGPCPRPPRRGVRKALTALAAVAGGALALGVLAAPAGAATVNGVKVTSANTSECPDGGLKLDDLRDDQVIPDGSYSHDGLTIVISDSTFEGDTVSFDWEATEVPEGTTVVGVVVKGALLTTTYDGGASGSVSWTVPPWYSHVSFCTGGIAAEEEPAGDPCPYDSDLMADDAGCVEPAGDPCPYDADLMADDAGCVEPAVVVPVTPEPVVTEPITTTEPVITEPVITAPVGTEPQTATPVEAIELESATPEPAVEAPEEEVTEEVLGIEITAAEPTTEVLGAEAVRTAELPRTGTGTGTLVVLGLVLLGLGAAMVAADRSKGRVAGIR